MNLSPHKMQMCSQVATLPLGCSSFERLRHQGCIYVDKTDIVCRLAETSGKYLLTRPHLFGKSLLISTFESLFRYGLRDFAGLKIQKLWEDDLRAYKVVRLDFSRVKVRETFSDFCSDLENFLETEFGKIGFCRNGPRVCFFNELSNFLSTLPVSSLVLLIDDSDGPLISSLGDKALFKSVQRKLNEFYAILKSNDHAMRFLFLTGTTLLNKANEFGGLNDLYDLSLDPAYGSLLGYSHEEIESCFSEFICRASTVLGMEREKLLEELTKNYGGFCFDEKAESKVFAPWSILSFFLSPQLGFKPYWIESGFQSSTLMQYLKSYSLLNCEECGNDKTLLLSSLCGSSDYDSISDLALLTQAGYLTIKAVKYNDIVELGYPNSEIRTAMSRLHKEMLLKRASEHR